MPTASLARSSSTGNLATSSSRAASSLLASQQRSSFSTFIGAVNTNTLGFLREKLITHDQPQRDRKRAAGKKSEGVGLAPVSRDLYRNIFFNSNERSALRHVELTPDYIRLEFSEPNEEYRKHADLLFASEAERRAQGVPNWLVPVELQNNEHCGGGATILLDKNSVYHSLSHEGARRRSSRHVARH